ATYSFHPVKSITTGEGGMAVTNDSSLANKLSLLRSHGITRDFEQMSKDPDGPWFNEQIDLGFNFRMTEIQAALGNSQLKRIDNYISKRNNIAEIYRNELQELPLKFQATYRDRYSAYHLFVIRLKLDDIEKTHLEIFNDLISEGIGVNLHYMPVYRHHYYSRFNYQREFFKESEEYYKEAISIPIFPNLTEQEQSYVIEAIKKIIK
ncbi:uncharacterized protein METZ01_LOCUS299237, partial [marine metagenome]